MSAEIMNLINTHPIAAMFILAMAFCMVLIWAACAVAKEDESCFPEETEGFKTVGREDCYTCEHSGHADDPYCENCSALKVEHFSNWEAKQS